MSNNIARRSLSAFLLFSLLITASGTLLSLPAILFPVSIGEEAAMLSTSPAVRVIVDAGHGGEDGGTVGVNGEYEKDINLSIAKKLYTMLTIAGVDAVMTRTEDRLLYTEEQNIRGQRKLYDLRNRLAFIPSSGCAVFVSIHMNAFSQQKYSGLQVYYSPNASGSETLARLIQNAARSELQPDNDRQVKRAGDNIYLMERAECIAVLVECGFLSNPEECEKLCSKDYQMELSFVLFCAIMEYIRNMSGSEG